MKDPTIILDCTNTITERKVYDPRHGILYEYYLNGRFVFGVMEKDRMSTQTLCSLWLDGYFD